MIKFQPSREPFILLQRAKVKKIYCMSDFLLKISRRRPSLCISHQNVDIIMVELKKMVKTADKTIELVIITEPRDMIQVPNTEIILFSLILSLEASPHRCFFILLYNTNDLVSTSPNHSYWNILGKSPQKENCDRGSPQQRILRAG